MPEVVRGGTNRREDAIHRQRTQIATLKVQCMKMYGLKLPTSLLGTGLVTRLRPDLTDWEEKARIYGVVCEQTILIHAVGFEFCAAPFLRPPGA